MSPDALSLPSPSAGVGASAVAAPPTPGDEPSRPTRTEVVIVVALAGMALLDALEPTILVTGFAWFALLLVWHLPGPPASDGPARAWRPLAALIVFAWLFFRTNSAMLELFDAWTPRDASRTVRAIAHAAQDAACAFAAAVLLATPVHRTFGRSSARAAFIIAAPWLAIACHDIATDPARWLDATVGTALRLFEGFFPPLLLVYACTRRTGGAGATRPLDREAEWPALHRFLRGELPVRRTAFLALLVLLPALWLLTHRFALPPGALAATELAGFAWEIAIAVATVLVTASMVALIRRLRRDGRRIGRVRLYGPVGEWFVALLLLGPFWFLTTFHAAPVIGDGCLSMLQNLPAPVWNVSYDSRSRTLLVAGAYGPGVADDFARALVLHPEARAVRLAGPGGLLREGQTIAERIAARGLSTVVSGDCASACTVAFSGGTERILEGDGRLGFHDSRNASVLLEWLKDTTEDDAFLVGRGFDRAFIARTHAVPSIDIWYPTASELTAAHVITSTR